MKKIWQKISSDDRLMVKATIAFFILVQMFLSYGHCFADVKRDGNNFIAQSSGRSKAEAKATTYTFTAKDGKTYPIYLSVNGRAYILRTSGKTGNEYKQYLDEEISRTICKELKVEYKEKKTTNK